MNEEFKIHLQNMFNLEKSQIESLIEEFSSYYNETVESYIRRRHDEMKSDGLKNNIIYGKLKSEIAEHRFSSPDLSERQIRRIIYG